MDAPCTFSQVAILHDRPGLFYDMQVRGAGFRSPYIDPDAVQLSLGISTKQHELLEGALPFYDYGFDSGVTISETVRATYAAIAFPMPPESQDGSQSHHAVVQRALAYMLAYTGGIFM